jgi:hypothetical protein
MLGKVKRQIKGKSKPLQELINHLHTKRHLSTTVLQPFSAYRVVGHRQQTVIIKELFRISSLHPDCYFLNQKNEFCVVSKITFSSNNCPTFLCNVYCNLRDFFTQPASSSEIGIFALYMSCKPSFSHSYVVADIKRKYVCLHNESEKVLIPMLFNNV